MKAHEFRHEMTTTSGIFGRHKDVEVVFEGNMAATDGKTIYLPALPDDAELSTEMVQAMRGYVDHEAGHLRHSDMPKIIKKYETWEKSGHPGIRQLHNYFEDIWMEHKVIDDYAGSEKNLKATSELVAKEELKWCEENREHLKGFNVDSVGLSVALEGRRNYSGEHARKLDEFIPEKIGRFAERWVDDISKCKNSTDVMNLAKAVYKLLEEDPELKSEPEDFDPNNFNEGDGEEGDDKPEDNQIPKNVKDAKEGKGKGKDGPPSLEEVLSKLVPGGFGNPQGDYVGSYRVMTTKYDQVFSVKNPGKLKAFTTTDVSGYNRSKAMTTAHTATMKNKLRVALLSKQRRDWDFGRQQGKLDSKRLVSAYNRNENVFKTRTDREEENTAIQILVDLSGSMSGPKVDLAQNCAIAIAECFEGTSLKYQISGFDAQWHGNSWGKGVHYDEFVKAKERKVPYHRVEANLIYNFKPFDVPLRQARPALGSITTVGQHNNADRDAILWCLNSLKRREEARKVLLVLSDGHPANQTINVNARELTRHAKMAVEWGTRQGIECIGIGIIDATVKDIYPKAVVVHDLKDLSQTAFRQFTDILVRGK